MALKQSDIEALVELFSRSDWDELHIEIDGEEILLSNDSRARTGVPATVAAAPLSQEVVPYSFGKATPTQVAPATGRPTHWVAIKAPHLGTFYKAPTPDAPPYVTVGVAVTPETEVCLIEVMKLFTTVRAGLAGTVREVSAQDGEMVEYGQPILWIEPG